MWTLLQQVPDLILAACAAIVILFLVFLFRMLAESRQVSRQLREFLHILKELPEITPANRRDGLTLEQIEQLRGHADARSSSRYWWSLLESHLEPYRPPDLPKAWFATRPVSDILPEDTLIDRHYDTSLYQSVPGILTGLGLMATFIAILVALQSVTVEVKGGAETVQGIGTLINGLAGKFLSSIVALFLAVLFTLAEKRVESRLTRGYHELIAQARSVIPVLDPTRVLLDLQAESSRRTSLLENMYGELVEKAVAAVRTEIAPVLSQALSGDTAAEAHSSKAKA
jgi:hypothetical protein